MSKILAFLNRHSVAICLAAIVAALFFMPLDAFAQVVVQQQYSNETGTGPFAAFLQRGATLFTYTRNALFVCAAFAFIVYAWNAIKDGEIKWEKLLYLVIALVLLGVAGYIVSYLANPDRPTKLQQDYEDLGDTQGWSR
ncbi:MAG: TrbC/VirB2 family protein [Rickettsiales bacterium]|nr:TrbC/VirB2 family protein [Rickettsiales bacterium]